MKELIEAIMAEQSRVMIYDLGRPEYIDPASQLAEELAKAYQQAYAAGELAVGAALEEMVRKNMLSQRGYDRAIQHIKTKLLDDGLNDHRLLAASTERQLAFRMMYNTILGLARRITRE